MPTKPDKPDQPRRYTVADVPWRLRDQLQHRAVLVPLTGRYRRKGEVLRRAFMVQRAWCEAVDRFRATGWPRLRGGRDAQAKACPIAFLVTHSRARPCCLRMACPSCWAREAARRWDRVDAAFFLDTRPTSPPPGPAVPPPRQARAEGYALVFRRRAFAVPAVKVLPDGTKINMLRDFYLARTRGQPRHLDPRVVPARAPEIKAGLKAIARPGRRSGCFENITAQWDRRHGHWRVAICQVWLVPREATLPAVVIPGGVRQDERRVEEPWRYQVMRAMATASFYPRALLYGIGGDADANTIAAARLIQARVGLRPAASYGAFRNRSPKRS